MNRKDFLKANLPKCTEKQQLLFKRMYSHMDLTLPINKVVDNMPKRQLNTAVNQVKKTLDKMGIEYVNKIKPKEIKFGQKPRRLDDP